MTTPTFKPGDRTRCTGNHSVTGTVLAVWPTDPNIIWHQIDGKPLPATQRADALEPLPPKLTHPTSGIVRVRKLTDSMMEADCYSFGSPSPPTPDNAIDIDIAEYLRLKARERAEEKGWWVNKRHDLDYRLFSPCGTSHGEFTLRTEAIDAMIRHSGEGGAT